VILMHPFGCEEGGPVSVSTFELMFATVLIFSAAINNYNLLVAMAMPSQFLPILSFTNSMQCYLNYPRDNKACFSQYLRNLASLFIVIRSKERVKIMSTVANGEELESQKIERDIQSRINKGLKKKTKRIQSPVLEDWAICHEL
jgi:hypothetical protein